MDILKQIGGFFGWLTGVLAGIGAMLYAFGFLATVTHNRLLGIGWIEASRDPVGYLEIGARIAAAWLLVGTPALVAVAVAVTVARLLVGAVAWLLPPRGGWRDRLRAGVAAEAPWLAAAVSAGLLYLILWQFDNALALRDLLFADAGTLCRYGSAAQAEVIAADAGEMRRRANGIFLLAALILIVSAFAGLSLRDGGGRLLPLTVCAIAAVNALGAVPTAHGLFVQSTDRPVATIAGALPPGMATDDLRLISVTRDGYWFWDPAIRQIHWLAKAELRHVQLSAPVPLRHLRCSDTTPAPANTEDTR